MTQLAEKLSPQIAEASFATAIAYHQAGRLAEAEMIYRELLASQPDQPDVLHLLGAIRAQNDQVDSAVELISRAIQLKADAGYYNTLARALKSRGRLDEAIAAYRAALKIKPDFAVVHNNLGVALRAAGEPREARVAFSAAIKIKPDFAEAHNNLGNLLVAAGRYDDAIAACRQAVALRPRYSDALNNLGTALAAKGSTAEAVSAYGQAIDANPALTEAWNNLGIALCEIGRLEDSVTALTQALRLRAGYAEAYCNLGNTLRKMGRLADAAAAYQSAIDLKPAYAEAHNNLGVVQWEMGKSDAAIASCKKAIQIKRDFPEAFNSLGNILRDRGELDRAIDQYQIALDLNPRYADAMGNLSVVLKDQSRFDEAVDYARRSLEIRPDHARHSNLIYLLNFHPGVSRVEIEREQAEWYRIHAEPLAAKIAAHGAVRAEPRRLRIGYISPNFRNHVVGLNILPLLREHDRKNFEIFCYSDVVTADAVTRQFQSHAEGWRNIVGLGDDRVAELIRQDEIDILVDLSLHLASNRLLVLARKPAPVQMTFAGYPGTTGLKTIDYRITDGFLDPSPSKAEKFEQAIRVPSFWCYDESAMIFSTEATPHPGALPAASASHVTFGCLNNFCKINDPVLQLWARVLAAVPNSRLLLLAPAGLTRKRTANRLAQLGIATDRIQFAGPCPRAQYFELYHRIDIGLDTFPYNGHSTSLDALWMGVPIVTLAGNSAVGRAGVSQLSNLGLGDLIATAPDDFVRISAELAGNMKLSELRAGFREKMRKSCLMDAARFVREIEKAYWFAATR